jgi:hypothetical protein
MIQACINKQPQRDNLHHRLRFSTSSGHCSSASRHHANIAPFHCNSLLDKEFQSRDELVTIPPEMPPSLQRIIQTISAIISRQHEPGRFDRRPVFSTSTAQAARATDFLPNICSVHRYEETFSTLFRHPRALSPSQCASHLSLQDAHWSGRFAGSLEDASFRVGQRHQVLSLDPGAARAHV